MKALKFLRLDLITVKPYLTWKTILLVLGVAVAVSFSTSLTMVIAILMIYGVMFAGYPFALGEKSSIDSLYCTLSISRNTVVAGRYLFSSVMLLGGGLLAFAVVWLVTTVGGLFYSGMPVFDPLEGLYLIIGCFGIYTLLQLVQLPIYFKMGYTKAKALAYLPLLGMPVAVILLSRLLGDSGSAVTAWIGDNIILAAAIALAILALLYIASMELSMKFYRKRDF